MKLQCKVMLCLISVSVLYIQIGCAQKAKLTPTPQHAFGVNSCSYTRAQQCNLNPNCPAGSTCKINASIDLTKSPPGVVVTINGQQADIVCIDRNTPIEWSPPAGFDVLLDFGNTSPFSSGLPYATGTNATPASGTSGSNLNKCYKYSIKVCPLVLGGSTTGFTCGFYDPIVIIGDGG